MVNLLLLLLCLVLYVSDDPLYLIVVSEYLLVPLEALEQVPVLAHDGMIVQEGQRGDQLGTLGFPGGRLRRGGWMGGVGASEVRDVRQRGTLLGRE